MKDKSKKSSEANDESRPGQVADAKQGKYSDGHPHVLQLTPLASLQSDLQVLWNPANNSVADHNVIFQLQLNLVW